jgi:putative FmdB family regulatory protein
MPIYEYQCQSCGHHLEKLQRMSDAPLSDCPECQQPDLRRLVSAAAFRLKGGGWYETDFKKDGRKNLHDSGTKPGADKKAAEASPKDAKPAAAKAEAGSAGGKKTAESPSA